MCGLKSVCLVFNRTFLECELIYDILELDGKLGCFARIFDNGKNHSLELLRGLRSKKSDILEQGGCKGLLLQFANLNIQENE